MVFDYLLPMWYRIDTMTVYWQDTAGISIHSVDEWMLSFEMSIAFMDDNCCKFYGDYQSVFGP